MYFMLTAITAIIYSHILSSLYLCNIILYFTVDGDESNNYLQMSDIVTYKNGHYTK